MTQARKNASTFDANGNLAPQSGAGVSPTSSLNGGQLAGMRNKIINGAFQFWRRGTSVTPSLGSITSYVTDRWASYQTGVAIAITQGAGTGGFKSAATWSGVASNTEVTLLQCVEAENAAQLLAGTQVTLGVFLYSTVVKTFNLYIDTANAADTFSATTNRASTAFGHPGTGWAFASLTYTTLHADVANGVRVRITAANCTSGSFGITGVQLETGGTATSFEHRMIGEELMLCQRYRQSVGIGMNGITASTTEVTIAAVLPVQMRGTPSINNPTSVMTVLYEGASNTQSSTSVTASTLTTNSALITLGAFSGLIAKKPVIVTAGGQIYLDAEL